jgi:hypothetical protein
MYNIDNMIDDIPSSSNEYSDIEIFKEFGFD